MANKSVLLLVIFLVGLLPATPAQAESQDLRSLDAAVNFLYLSDAILTPEADLDLALHSGGFLSPADNRQSQTQVNINPLLARIIHAKKMQRNDLDANCKLLVQQLKGQGKDCEADQIQSYCSKKRAEINTLIGFYHRKRGDQRKFFTRVWHSIKRNAQNFWSKIGPLGRNFLRHMGDEALQVVASGGVLSGGTLRTLVKNYVKSQARNRIKQVVYQGVERLLKGQLEIAQAAGVDLCDEDISLGDSDETKASEDQAGVTDRGQIPDGTKWQCMDIEGPVSQLITRAEDMPNFKTNYYNYDHWITYTESPPSLHYFYSYTNSEDIATTMADGSLGDWTTSTWSGEIEVESVPVDQYGVFTISLTWDEIRTERGNSVDVAETHNRWGLIPPDDYQTIFLCDWGPREMPTGLDNLSPSNFKSRCGPPGAYYYECFLPED